MEKSQVCIPIAKFAKLNGVQQWVNNMYRKPFGRRLEKLVAGAVGAPAPAVLPRRRGDEVGRRGAGAGRV